MKPADARSPKLRVIDGGGQLSLWRTTPETVIDHAIPLAKQLQLITDVMGAEAHREVADALVELLEGSRRPRRIA